MKSAALLAVALLCCASVASARLFSSPEEWKAEARRNLQGESQPAASGGCPACLQPSLGAPIAPAAACGPMQPCSRAGQPRRAWPAGADS